jgi:benzil reductase ((S)-benzoin forming)
VLNKKNIIITGNTSGIGLNLNKILIKNNNITGISKSNSKIQNNKQIKVNFNNLNYLKKNILKAKIPKTIDYLILNAGILGKIDKIENISVKNFLETLTINFLANKILIDALIKKKIKLKNVIAISSGAAKSGKDGWGLYCTSKGAFYQLINTYALENEKIKFINLAPGLAKTKMQDEIYAVKNKKINSIKKFQKLYRMNKISSPEAIAKKIIVFLNDIKKFKSGSFIDLRNFT